MSWLPQRWRTQRNAIRNANCNIQWVIKTLNATCTSSEVCLLECLFIPTTKPSVFVKSAFFAYLFIFNKWAKIGLDENLDKTDLVYLLWHYFFKREKRRDVKLIIVSLSSVSFLNETMKTKKINKKTLGAPFGSPIRQDYPLNLSILIRGGKETNKDSLSKGDWSGKSSDWKSSEL